MLIFFPAGSAARKSQKARRLGEAGGRRSAAPEERPAGRAAAAELRHPSSRKLPEEGDGSISVYIYVNVSISVQTGEPAHWRLAAAAVVPRHHDEAGVCGGSRGATIKVDEPRSASALLPLPETSDDGDLHVHMLSTRLLPGLATTQSEVEAGELRAEEAANPWPPLFIFRRY